MKRKAFYKKSSPPVISSQKYLSGEIVAEKRAAEDYAVRVVLIEIDGEGYAVVVDGHHSLAAAKADDIEPEWQKDKGEMQLWASRDPAGFMEANQHDADWYNVRTGRDIW